MHFLSGVKIATLWKSKCRKYRKENVLSYGFIRLFMLNSFCQLKSQNRSNDTMRMLPHNNDNNIR